MAVVFLLYVIAEVAAIWAVGSVVGVLGTIGLLIAGAAVTVFVKSRSTKRALNA